MENPQPAKKSFWASPTGAASIGALIFGGGTGIICICIIDTLFPELLVGPSFMVISIPATIVAGITGLEQTAPDLVYGKLFVTVTNAVLGAALAALLFMIASLFKSKCE